MNPITSLPALFGLNSPLRRRRLRSWLRLEPLEDRAQPSSSFPSIDGTGHNPTNPEWGSTGIELLRRAAAEYEDGASAPAGADRPSAREISNAVADQPDDVPLNNRDMSAFVYVWGQFIDHDLDLTLAASPAEPFPISVPTGDPFFDPLAAGTQIIPLNRANYNPATGTEAGNPRQQINSITAWIDASMVYGSDAETAAKLRTFSGGHLKTGDGNLLPTDPDSGAVMAGDIRAAENPELTAMQVLFVREHNRIADEIAAENSGLTDEEIYQQARLRVIGEIQAITFNEFLPALLGSAAPRGYSGYRPNVNPGIANEFSTAAFRIGHTLVGDEIEFLDNDGNAIRPPLSLREAFFNTGVLVETGIDPILKYVASDRANEVDTLVIDDLRNFLFGPPGAGGLDLASLNIQRGRDHGLADYNSVRAAYGLPRVRSFAQITSNRQLQQALQDLYGDVDNIDLWVGGLAEDHLPGSSVGPTFARIIADQFARLRAGDRFWYQNAFTGSERRELERTSLADVIRRNTGVTNLQDNVFFFRASISGHVFADTNGDGIRNRGERGLRGRVVELLDADGVVLATAVTRRDGGYRFDHLDLGTYQVREVLPPGAVATRQPDVIEITRGMELRGMNLGETPPQRPTRERSLSLLGPLMSSGFGDDGDDQGVLPRRPLSMFRSLRRG